MCKTYDKSKGGDTRELQSRMVPPKKTGSSHLKAARYSFPGPIPPKFEHKLRRHKLSFEKIATTVVLDKDENLL